MIDIAKLISLIESGNTVKDIAMKLDCSDKTVRVWVLKIPQEMRAKLKQNGRNAQRRSAMRLY